MREPDTFKEVSQVLRTHPILSKFQSVQSLLKDLEFPNDPSKRLFHLKNHINQQKDNVVFSLFYASYFPSLSIDGFIYDELPRPVELEQRMSSPVLAVNILSASSGFHKKSVVALFPENHIDNIQLPEDKIFYFINKFVERFNNITRKLLPLVDFSLINDLAMFESIESLCVYWVWLHEHFHRQGDMPIPKYLKYKSLKPLAGLEELRVDIASIRHCLHSGWIEPQKAKMIAIFILTERLLRYAVEGVHKPNYDAIASQVLFQYLVNEGVISIRPDKSLSFHPEIFEATFQFLDRISRIESSVNTHGPKKVQEELLAFVDLYKKDAGNINNYSHSDYFVWVKQSFQV